MQTRRPPESEAIEYKREMTNSFLKTVSAFANFNGGVIEFGIDDDLTVRGIENPIQFAESLANKINDNIKPTPPYDISVNDSDQTVVLVVRSGLQTPYLYNNKAYERRSSSTIETGSLTFQDLILKGRNLTYDALPAFEPLLSFSQLEKSAQSVMGIERLGSDTLISLGLAGKNGYNRAAELLADHNDYPGLEVVRFGADLSTIRKRETIEHISLLEQYERALAFFKDNYLKEVIDGSVRRYEEEIPETAFREALVNALIHRNWAISGAIQVHMFPDRIEIRSPGGLPEGVSAQEYLTDALSVPTLIHRNWAISGAIQVHMFPDRIEIRSPGGLPEGVSAQEYLTDALSVPRNPHLAYVFLRLNLIGRPGTGIRRIREAYAGLDASPSFSVHDSSIKVVLPVPQPQKEMTLEQEELYRLLNPNILYSRKELETLTGYKRSKLMRIVNELGEKKLVKTVGNGRSTKYRRI